MPEDRSANRDSRCEGVLSFPRRSFHEFHPPPNQDFQPHQIRDHPDRRCLRHRGLGIASHAQVPSPTIVYTFQGGTTDVHISWGPKAQGQDGNLYGTGQSRAANGTGGVFKLTSAGVETLLASFPGNWIKCATKGG